MILFATYLAGYFIFGSHWAGVGAALGWFLLPWIELLTRIRNMRLPIKKKLKHVPPPGHSRFPA